MKKQKIGRNEQCPCGSGKKYKFCHGCHLEERQGSQSRNAVDNKSEVLEKQRLKQQGFGRPIHSVLENGRRVVRVGSTTYHSNTWKTFGDFLFDYIKIVFGSEWGNEELRESYDERHPILQWYELVCKQQQAHAGLPNEIYTMPMTGAAAAYNWLSYNLYLIAHNAKLQETLVARLKEPKQFWGAYYETFVAAAMIKAGFELEFENEADPTNSHCEFTATYPETGVKFSVEAKARGAGKVHADVGKQLGNALRKKAKYKRIVFIDVNVPDKLDEQQVIPYVPELMAGLRRMESSLKIKGVPAPAAYVLVTNYPFHYSLREKDFRWSVVGEGFKISGFKADKQYTGIREALNDEKEHYEIYKLVDSMRDHYQIPSTFDGQIPEFAFNKNDVRLIVGQKYSIPVDGKGFSGVLTDAVVDELGKKVTGIYRLDDGRSIIATCPISDLELQAYQRYPETFFGVYKETTQKQKDPLQLFHWLMDCYGKTDRAKLLEFMKDHPDYNQLIYKSQAELAFLYCERIAHSGISMSSKK